MAPKPNIGVVLFDLGGVLIELDMERCARYWAETIAMDLDEMIELFWQDTDYQRLERGQIDLPVYHRLINTRLAGRLGFEDFQTGWNGVFMGLAAGALELLDDLSGQVRLLALSNTNTAHKQVFSALYPELSERFETIYCSQEIGSRKPEPACFRHVLDRAGAEPEGVVFVDDRAENIAAAQRLGMVGIQAEAISQVRRDLARLGLDV